MIADEGGRSVIHCNRCTARLDLGPTVVVQQRLRMPSGWIQEASDTHLCPICANRMTRQFVATRSG